MTGTLEVISACGLKLDDLWQRARKSNMLVHVVAAAYLHSAKPRTVPQTTWAKQ